MSRSVRYLSFVFLVLYSLCSFAGIDMGGTYKRVIHIQTEVQHIIFLVVQNYDESWDFGVLNEEKYFVATSKNIGVDIDSDSEEIRCGWDGKQYITAEIVGEHLSIRCLPHCPGCL